MTETFEPLTITPDSDEIPSCKTCGAIIEWSGRGRKPEHCTKHRKGSARSVTGTPSTSTDKIIDALGELYVAVGFGVSFIDNFDGMTITQASGNLAESWRPLIDNDPKIKKALSKLVEASGWGGVLIAHAMVAAPIVAHHSNGALDRFFNPQEPIRAE